MASEDFSMSVSAPKNPTGHSLPEATISAATRCKCEHSCLQDEMCMDEKMCRIESRISPELAFVEKNGGFCGYHFKFGNGDVCTCPVRLALHDSKKA